MYGDFDEISPGLFQGSYPEEGLCLHNHGFDVLVLCAQNYQTPAEKFPHVEVVYAPNVDDLWQPPSEQRLRIASEAAKKVASFVREGKKVLVTCQAGLNRSGLVSAMALHVLHGWSGTRCVKQVQDRRFDALFNTQFVTVLRKLRAKRRAA